MSDFAERGLPALNACLNGLSFVCLVVGYRHIRRGAVVRHRNAMLSALLCSSLFLLGYLSRVYLTGTHRFAAAGALKTFYLCLLFSHMVLAVVVVPLIGAALYLALRGQIARHRRVTVWAWPIWVYVSLTGVLVYLMLYQLAPRLHA